ncbi:MAG: hypothetical protein M0Z49_02865, partial [Chloroflexi bacterium]|nr:hypothetical protein [Chloroflexota bacterium]
MINGRSRGIQISAMVGTIALIAAACGSGATPSPAASAAPPSAAASAPASAAASAAASPAASGAASGWP